MVNEIFDEREIEFIISQSHHEATIKYKWKKKQKYEMAQCVEQRRPYVMCMLMCYNHSNEAFTERKWQTHPSQKDVRG